MSIATYDLASLTYDSASTAYDGSGAGLANMPVVGVFISFTDGPYVVEPTWVEVTQYVRDINVRRGRGNDLQQFPSGSATLTLDNRARLFDPFNTAGIYYGNLKPRRQIKIVGQWAGVTYPIFRGFIAGWPVGYSDGGKDSTVQIDCFDALGLLATEVYPANFLDEFTRSLSPTHYYKIDDGPTATELKDQFGGQAIPQRDFGVRFFESPALAEGIKSSALYFRGAFTDLVSNLTPTTTQFSFAFWNVGTSSDLAYDFFSVLYATGGLQMELQFASGTVGFPRILYKTMTAEYERTFDVSGIIRFDQPSHYALTFDSSTLNLVVYINGAATPTTLVTTTPSVSGNYEFINLELTTMQEFSTYNRVLTAAEVASLYAFSTARVQETTLARMNRLIAGTSISTAITSFDATTLNTVLDIGVTESILNEVQKVVLSEAGEFFVSSSGLLTFFGNDWFARKTRSNTSQVTFTDTGTGVYYDHSSLFMSYDADLVRNDLNLTFSSGGQVTSTSTASIAEYGAANVSVATYIDVPASAQSIADEQIVIYKNPKLRIEPFMVKGQRNPSYDWPRLLALELLDRFTFVRTPSTGSAVTQDMLLQSIEHRITPGSWETVVNGSARFTGWFIIGTSLIGGTDVLL
jgi:hypothetical protein